MTDQLPEQRVAVLEGVVQRLGMELAQARVTVAELDTNMQMQTAELVRVEAELAAAQNPPSSTTDSG